MINCAKFYGFNAKVAPHLKQGMIIERMLWLYWEANEALALKCVWVDFTSVLLNNLQVLYSLG